MKGGSPNKCLVIIIVIIITIQDAVSKLGELADVNMAIDYHYSHLMTPERENMIDNYIYEYPYGSNFYA